MCALRVAVVGLGLGKTRALGYLQNEHARLCAVCDTDTNRLVAFLKEHEGVRGYRDYEEMLAAEKPDIVNISTPDWLHLPQALLALEHGCHVLLEKPMVTSLAEAETLVAAVEKSGLKLMVGQNYRRAPLATVARELIASGRLGTLYLVVSEHFQHKVAQFTRSPWYASHEHPRSAMLGTGIHAMDMLRYLAGEVEEVFAYGSHRCYPEFPGNDFVTALCRCASGIIGRVSVAYISILPRGPEGPSIQLFGTQGTFDSGRLCLGEPGQAQWEQVELPKVRNPFWEEVDHFIACIRNNQNPMVDVREGARNVAACLACDESVRTGQPVRPQRF